jgi:hypothetical protein
MPLPPLPPLTQSPPLPNNTLKQRDECHEENTAKLIPLVQQFLAGIEKQKGKSSPKQDDTLTETFTVRLMVSPGHWEDRKIQMRYSFETQEFFMDVVFKYHQQQIMKLWTKQVSSEEILKTVEHTLGQRDKVWSKWLSDESAESAIQRWTRLTGVEWPS